MDFSTTVLLIQLIFYNFLRIFQGFFLSILEKTLALFFNFYIIEEVY